MAEYEKIAEVSEIKPGEGQSFTMGDKIIGVFNVDGEIFAINDLCPHMGASLSAGHVEGCTVTCPWHAWRFSVDDGTWCDNPKLKVDVYETKVIDGQIWISKEPRSTDSEQETSKPNAVPEKEQSDFSQTESSQAEEVSKNSDQKKTD